MQTSIINLICVVLILCLSGILILPVAADMNMGVMDKNSNPEISSETSKFVARLGEYNFSKQDQNKIIQALNKRKAIELLVSKKERELQQNKLTIKDQRRGIRMIEGFSPDAKDPNSRIPEGGIIQFSPNGVTRVFSTKGEQIFDVKDSDAQMVMTPSGKIIPVTHVFAVPEDVIVYNSGNRDYYIRDGKILFIKDKGEQKEENIINKIQTSPAPLGNMWIAYAESDSISNPAVLTSQWIVPDSPPTSVNILFNGLEPDDGSYIVQPVVAFNYNGHNDNGIQWQNHWTGASWLCDQTTIPNDCDYKHPAIAANQGDHINGAIARIPLPAPIPDLWAITTTDVSSGQSTMYLKFYKNASASPSRVVTTYEMHPSQLDRLKIDNTTFTNLVARDTSLNSIPLTMHGKYHFLENPHLTGMYVDTSQSPQKITIFTDYSFSIVTTTDGKGEIKISDGTVEPSGRYPIKSNQEKEFFINASPGYTIDDVLVDGQSKGPIKNYTFKLVNPEDMKDHTISATFKQSFCSMLTFTDANFQSSAVQQFNSGDPVPAGNYTLNVTGWNSPWSSDHGWWEEGVTGTTFKAAAWRNLTNLRVEGDTSPLSTIVNGTFARENSTGSAYVNLSSPSRVGIIIIDSAYPDNRGAATFVLSDAGQTCSATAMKESVNVLPSRFAVNGNITSANQSVMEPAEK
jgi:hypothetical protein